MKRSKTLILAVALATLFASNVALAQQSKSPVCHITGAYDFGDGPVAIGTSSLPSLTLRSQPTLIMAIRLIIRCRRYLMEKLFAHPILTEMAMAYRTVMMPVTTPER